MVECSEISYDSISGPQPYLCFHTINNNKRGISFNCVENVVYIIAKIYFQWKGKCVDVSVNCNWNVGGGWLLYVVFFISFIPLLVLPYFFFFCCSSLLSLYVPHTEEAKGGRRVLCVGCEDDGREFCVAGREKCHEKWKMRSILLV